MKALLNFSTLLPIGLFILQAIALFFTSYLILKKIRWIKEPLGGMDYGQAIISGSVLLSVFLIDIACVNAGFQAFKAYQNQGGAIVQPLLSKYGQFFAVILFFEALFAISTYILRKLLISGIKGDTDSDNIPLAIFLSAGIIGLAILYQQMAKELISYIVPKFLSFR